jgi:hypothetical protein
MRLILVCTLVLRMTVTAQQSDLALRSTRTQGWTVDTSTRALNRGTGTNPKHIYWRCSETVETQYMLHKYAKLKLVATICYFPVHR